MASFLLLTACSGKTANALSSVAVPREKTVSTEAKASSAPAPAKSASSAPVKKKVKVHESSDPRVIKLYTAASNFYTKDDYTSAVRDCDAALALDPLCYEAINIKGAAQYYATGDPQQGLPLINRCIALNPYYQYGYFNKALIYKGEKNWPVSIGLFNKVISLNPKNAWAYYGISTIYADRNMVSQSLAYLKKAIAIDPSVKATARVQNHYDRMRSNKAFQALVK
jgi:Putative Zn-dependent protease, contains TPR repeats